MQIISKIDIILPLLIIWALGKGKESSCERAKAVRLQRGVLPEGALLRLIKDGNVAATIFFLKTQGRSRGYGESPPQRASEAEMDWLDALDSFKV